MAEIIRAQPGNIPQNVNINLGVAEQTAQANNSLARTVVEQGGVIQQDSTGAQMTGLGQVIAQESVNQLAQASASIQNSVYADKFTNTTTNFLAKAQNRSKQVMDENGNPLFGTLVKDIGQLGANELQEALKNVTDPVVREKLTANFNSQIATSQLQAMTTANKQQADFAAASYVKLKDTTLKQANLDTYENIDVYTGRLKEVLAGQVASGMISAESAQSELLNLDKGLRVSHIEQSIDADPYQAYSALSQDKGELGLNAADVLDLKNKAENGVAKANSMKNAQAAAIKEEYGELISQTKDLILRGVAVPKGQLDYLRQVTAGTKVAGSIEKLAEQAQISERFASLSVQDQEQFLALAEKEGTSDPALMGFTTVLRKQLDNTKKAIEDDPMKFAAEQGLVNSPPLDFNGDVLAQINQKSKEAKPVNQLYNTVSSGLTTADMKKVNDYYTTLSPQDQITFANSIHNQYGNNANIFFKEMYQNGGENASFVGFTAKTDNGLATDLANGYSALKDKNVPMPSGKNLDELKRQVITSLPPQVNESLSASQINGAVALYALEAKRKGLDPEVVDTSVIMSVVGRIAPSVEYNGSKVSTAGSTITQDQFDAGIRTMTSNTLDALGGINPDQVLGNATPLDIVKRGTFVGNGAGTVIVVAAEHPLAFVTVTVVAAPRDGGQPLLTANGQLLTIPLDKIPKNIQPASTDTSGAAKVMNLLKGISTVGKQVGKDVTDYYGLGE